MRAGSRFAYSDSEGCTLKRRRGGAGSLERSGTLASRDDRSVASDLHAESDDSGKGRGGSHAGGCEETGNHFGCGVLVGGGCLLYGLVVVLNRWCIWRRLIHVGLPEMVANVVCSICQ